MKRKGQYLRQINRISASQETGESYRHISQNNDQKRFPGLTFNYGIILLIWTFLAFFDKNIVTKQAHSLFSSVSWNPFLALIPNIYSEGIPSFLWCAYSVDLEKLLAWNWPICMINGHILSLMAWKWQEIA